jgi:hypothetical protein
VPDKVAEGGAHPRMLSTATWQFIDGKPTLWLKAEVEGSYNTGRLMGGVRHGKSDETRARGGAHRRRPRRWCFSQNLARRRPSGDRAWTRCNGEGVGCFTSSRAHGKRCNERGARWRLVDFKGGGALRHGQCGPGRRRHHAAARGPKGVQRDGRLAGSDPGRRSQVGGGASMPHGRMPVDRGGGERAADSWAPATVSGFKPVQTK